MDVTSKMKLIKNCMGSIVVLFSELSPQGGAKLVGPEVSTEDLTICLRFNLQMLGRHEGRSHLIHIQDWKIDNTDPDFRFA